MKWFFTILLLISPPYIWGDLPPPVELNGTDGSTLSIQFDSQGQVTTLTSSDGLISATTRPRRPIQVLQKYAAHLTPLKTKLAHLFSATDVWDDLENIGNDWLPSNIFFFFGFREEEVDTGTVGSFDFNDKIRFTAINGVLNDFQSVRRNAEMISSYTGGVRIHFVCRPSSGWPGDFFNALLTMSGLRSPMAEHLVQKWRELIQEMGGVGGGGRIIHYSHSLGSVDTIGARDLLLPEEAAMIEVYAFASPRAVSSDGFHYVVNYCSVRDQVWLLDPTGYYKHNVIFLKSTGLYGYDHRWRSPVNQSVIKALGEKWLHQYGSNKE